MGFGRHVEVVWYNLDMDNNSQLTFSKHHNHVVVGILDIVHSTESTFSLSGEAIDEFYSIFLSSVSTVIHENGGKVLKNIGDGVLWYFPKVTDRESDSFEQVAMCGRALLRSKDEINKKLSEHGLPPVSFRISMSFGLVSAMCDERGEVVDLFGATINTCAKMNKYAPENGFVVGEVLNEKLNEIGIVTEKISDFQVGENLLFSVFEVK